MLSARILYRLLAPAGSRAKLTTFIFHRVLPNPDPLLCGEPHAEQFEWMARFFARSLHVLPLGEAVDRLQAGTLPAAAASITFDDGYADNLTVAWPILQRFGLTATFFIATSFLDGGRMWNDDVIESARRAPEGEWDLSEFGLEKYRLSDIESRIRCYGRVLDRLKYVEHGHRTAVAKALAHRSGVPGKSDLMLTTPQLRDLRRAGAEIGAHTASHPILELLPNAEAEEEIVAGREVLADILGEDVRLFAYPNGRPGRDYSARHVQIVKRVGFAAAVSTEGGVARGGVDIHQIPRFTPWDRTPLRFAMRSAIHLARS